jgi:hypothetical protein
MQNEGNMREILLVVDTAGVVTNVNDFDSPRMIDVKGVFYSPSDSSFVIAADHISDIETRASIYKFDYFLNYVCYASANSVKNSYVGEAIVTNDGFIVMNGTYDFVAPGLSSFFLMKTTLNCDANLNIMIGIEESEKNLSDNLMAFPNPSSGNFNIRLNLNPKLIELVDLTGKKIPLSTSYHSEILSIDAGSIAPGMYVLKIQTSQNSPILYQSIIINR